MARKAPPDDYVIETLLPDLVGHDRAPSAFLVYLKLWHAAGGPGRQVQISLSSLPWKQGFPNPRSRRRSGVSPSAGYVEPAR